MLIVTIPFSHYNERARWALQHHGVACHEQRHLPGLHMRGVKRVTTPEQRKGDKTGSPLSTPVLVLDDGEVLGSSTEIVRWADERFSNEETTLYPPEHREEIEALEQHAHDVIGPDSRVMVYWFLFQDGPAFSELARDNAPRWQSLLFGAMRPFAKKVLTKHLKIDEARFKKAKARFAEDVDRLSERLGDREYLVGGRFTAADLTVASMIAPAVLPLPSYGAKLPHVGLEECVQVTERTKATKIGQHTMRMFEKHRPRNAAWTVG